MDILALMFLAHLVGDYLLQNDTISNKKVHPSFNATLKKLDPVKDVDKFYSPVESLMWCLLHCSLYTASVAFFSLFSTMGLFHWSMLLVCFVTHFLIDHFRLARKYMTFAGQEKFATEFCAPWSIFVVDNTFHILTSWLMVVIQLNLLT